MNYMSSIDMPCRDFIPLELARGTQEGSRLILQHLHVNVVRLTLHLEKRGFFVQFVLGHNVDFILALAVPPSADARVGLAFDQHTPEIAFEHQTAERLVVPVDDRLHALVVLYLQHIAVLVDEAEPEREEVVLYRIADILGGTLLEEGLLLGDDLVLVSSLVR